MSGVAWAQNPNPALARLVQPTPGTRSLGAVLTELAQQGNLPLSYSSSLVPVAHQYTLRPGPARPLGVVLREVLAAEHLSYGLLDGQLVLWPARVTAPVGVTSVNGRPGHIIQSPVAHSSKLPAVPPSTPSEAIVANPTVTSRNPTSRPAAPAGPRESGVAGTATSATAPTARSAKSSGQFFNQKAKSVLALGVSPSFLAKAPLTHGIITPSASRNRTSLAGGSKPNKLPTRVLPTTKQRTANPSDRTAASTLPYRDQSHAGFDTKSQRTGPGVSLANSPATARRPLSRPSQLRGAVDSLSFLRSTPAVVPASDGVGPVVLASAAGPGPNASPTRVTDPATKPFALASLLHPSYLHGEAWVSESMPLNAAVKVGIPRLYLVLGVATGPTGRQSGGVAWGVGLGTAGQLRGRFTPSLDLVHWFVSGDRETPPSSLTQLRPQLGWQLKQGGRWQLIGGPTLNLATARQRGPQPQRWDFGRDQWLWVNQADGESLLRLWPGVQVGIRF